MSRSSSVPPNTRDALYQGLPPYIKAALRPKLQSFHVKEEVCIVYIYGKWESSVSLEYILFFFVLFLIWLLLQKSFQSKLLILPQVQRGKRKNKWAAYLLIAYICWFITFFKWLLIKKNNLLQMVFLQLTIPQIKAEMEKTLEWLVPIAANTTK